jgi:guanylate kinase
LKKTIVLIVGPSGSGKTTLMHRVFKQSQFIRGVTTRPMRPTEKKNVDYLFFTKQRFDELLKRDRFIQQVEYDHEFYGVLKDEISNKFRHHQTLVIPVIYPAVQQFEEFARENNYQTLTVFTDISYQRLTEHFKERKESPSQKQKRLAKYQSEIKFKNQFDSSHILDMNPDDHGKSAGEKLKMLLKN